jgi:DNA-binding GntR family transcriptional regulator
VEPTGRRVSGAHVVYTALHDQITSLQLAPGTRLHETELAASLAVSRTPLREALRMLLADGLVRQLPTGGMVVAPLDPEDMRDLYEVRAALEGVVARQACARLTDADVTELETVVDRMSRLVDYPDEMLRLGQSFHGRLLAISRNQHAAQLLRVLRGHLSRYQALTATIDPRRREAYAEHREILAALRARDAQRAETLMRDHVLAAYREGAVATGTTGGSAP